MPPRKGTVLDVSNYMSRNGKAFWSVGYTLWYDRDVYLPPRVWGRFPIQCDIYPETLDRGDVIEIVKLTHNLREGIDASIEAHRQFLVSAGLAYKEKED